jgi:hypothetical protein
VTFSNIEGRKNTEFYSYVVDCFIDSNYKKINPTLDLIHDQTKRLIIFKSECDRRL